MLGLLLMVPALATLVLAIVPKGEPFHKIFELVHLISISLVLVIAGLLGMDVYAYESLSFLGDWFIVDKISLIFVLIIAVIGFLTGVYSLAYVRHDKEEATLSEGGFKTYYVFFQLFIFTMLLAVLSNNLVMMWVSVEATTLATVFLVGIYQQKSSLEAAWKYIIICACGVAFGLYGCVLVYANASQLILDAHHAAFWTYVMSYASQLDPTIVKIAFVFVAVGIGTKAGLFPMHSWLPDAHSEAPSPVSALLSAVLLKCAMLVVIRFYILVAQAIGYHFPQTIMLILGVISVLYAAFALFIQKDFKRKLAYSSVENMGVVALCLGFGGYLGVLAALCHVIAHSLTKALMFCLSGNVLITYKTRDLDKIQGILRVAPLTGALLILGILAISGVPPFAMFVSELAMVVAGIVAGKLWLVIVIALALTVVIAAFVLIIVKNVMKQAPEKLSKKEVSPLILIPELVFVALLLILCIAPPQIVKNNLQDAAKSVVAPAVSVEKTADNSAIALNAAERG